jgi:lipopolysaccharide/colanic/teichoic acid biosynthesis glycosyltransferase
VERTTGTEIEVTVAPQGNGAIAAAAGTDLAATSPTSETTFSDQRRFASGLKRVADISLALVLLVLLSPLILAIALAIRLDSPGPVLFRQARVGRGGTVFGLLKFRTMVDGADGRKSEFFHLNEAPDGLFKIANDPRLTRFGAFLRSTSLDELPQLFQVLSGRMSLVGPRPLVPEEDELIRGAYRDRLLMRPGMTGPWQVAGASRVPLSIMVELDREYLDGWSVLGDLKLIVRTVPHVVRRRGI